MKCKQCVESGQSSQVYVGGSTTTLMGFQPHYDEAGNYHHNDPNKTTTQYSCSNGHRWAETSGGSAKNEMATCECGFPKGSRECLALRRRAGAHPVPPVKTIRLPIGGVTIAVPDTNVDAIQKIINARHAFILTYCRERGWPEDGAELSIEQILEIRAQDGWKNPCGDSVPRMELRVDLDTTRRL